MDLGRLVEWIKLSPRHLLPLAFFTGFVPVAPTNVLDLFALLGLTGTKRG